MRGRKRTSYEGRIIDDLKVIKYIGVIGTNGYYLVRCKCGCEFKISIYTLTRESVFPKSCLRCRDKYRIERRTLKSDSQIPDKFKIHIGKQYGYLKILSAQRNPYRYYYEFTVYCGMCRETSTISKRAMDMQEAPKRCRNCSSQSHSVAVDTSPCVRNISSISSDDKSYGKNDLLATFKLSRQPWLYARKFNG